MPVSLYNFGVVSGIGSIPGEEGRCRHAFKAGAVQVNGKRRKTP